MDEYGFRQFLESKSLSESSIDHYCSYIRSIVKAYGFNTWDKTVESKDITRKYIANLVNNPMFLQESSARCYRRALCLLYECKYSEKVDGGCVYDIAVVRSAAGAYWAVERIGN